MGRVVLKDIIEQLDQFTVEDVTYVPEYIDFDDISAVTPILTLRFDSQHPNDQPHATKYFLEISVMREVLEGLEAQLGRTLSLGEKIKAIRHYAKHDAYIDPTQLSL